MIIAPSSKQLNILILYSDGTSGHKTKRAFDRFLNKIDPVGSGREQWLDYRLWRLDLLKQPEIQTLASRDVAAAVMVVVAVGQNLTGWDVFKNWARGWPVGRRAARRAMVAFQPDSEISDPAATHSVAFLRQLADQKGMDMVTNHPTVACATQSLPLETPVPTGGRQPLSQSTIPSTEQYNHEFFFSWRHNE